LRLISFLEEEGSGFGQMLLGSRIMLQRVSEEELRETFRDEHGVSFWDCAEAAGYEPARWRESIRELDGLTGWVEVHIEQGRVLQDTGNRLGIVEAIVGYIHGDLHFRGRADHAGATPMDFRLDAAVPAAETIVELERLANELGGDVVGTVGEIEVLPDLINVVPGGVRLSLDLRSVSDLRGELCRQIVAFARERGAARGIGVEWVPRQELPVQPMDTGVVEALRASARESGEPFRQMPSGAAHDTQCVASRVPSAMVFVPCLDGLSHTPLETADPADAALAAEVVYEAIKARA
jgi:allantoate deiminase